MIYLGADHRGFPVKERVKKALDSLGYKYKDLGTHSAEEMSDFPDFAFAVGEKIAADPDTKNALGVLSCGSAGGMVIAANKVKGVRGVHAMSPELASRAREHDDANVLIVDANFTDIDDIPAIVEAFLSAEFDAVERRVRRRDKITNYEKNHA